MTDIPTWDQLDTMVDTDPIGLRDLAAQLAGRLETMTAVARDNDRAFKDMAKAYEKLETEHKQLRDQCGNTGGRTAEDALRRAWELAKTESRDQPMVAILRAADEMGVVL